MILAKCHNIGYPSLMVKNVNESWVKRLRIKGNKKREVFNMNKFFMVIMLILSLVLCGISCKRSSEQSEVKPKVVEEKKSLIEEAFEKEPKPPSEAITEEGVLLEEEFATPPE